VDAQPEISVVVPVYRHWTLVPDLVAALARQTLERDRFEILLVDNDPAAGTAPLPLPGNAHVLACAEPGSYAARNAGAASARGALIAFTDADCRPDPNWLEALRAAARARPGDLLAGPVRMIPPARANAFAAYDLVRGIPQAAYVRRGYAATANLAVPATIFRALGGFDARRFSGGDAAFCRRAGAAGHAITLVPDAVVSHPCRTAWDEIATKARRTKGGQVAAGPLPRRVAWTLRTLCPPVRDTLAYLRAPFPVRERAMAIAVRFGIWGLELTETVRLLAGGTPERR
jgi:GT2 family glycosyltransferase